MKKYVHLLWLMSLLLFPVILWVLPVEFFNDGNGLSCPSQSLLGIECLGCGMTRAVMHFHHFDFLEAIYYNTLVVLIYPLLLWLWQKWVRAELRFLHVWPRTEASVSN